MDQDASTLESELIGARLADRYEILSLIGHGGMGAVYKAKHVLLDKLVAVKLLQSRYLTDSSNQERFQQEAKAASSLMHSNVVSVIDYGITDQGAPYLVMDFLEGATLAELIKRENHLEEKRAVRIFLQIARALNHIHSRGVLHRDLKPGNIMLLNNESETDLVKIMDFGISRRTDFEQEGAHITQKGKIIGSPLYMSPEQCVGRNLDERSDIYSFGCLMYEVLIGVPPLVGENPIQTVFKHAREKPMNFKEVRPGLKISSELERAVLKALEKRPEDRYRNAKELTEDLELFHRGEQLKDALRPSRSAYSDGERAQTKRFNYAVVILSLVTGICLVAILFGSFATTTGSIVRGELNIFLQQKLFHASQEKTLRYVTRLADFCMENARYRDADDLYERAATLSRDLYGARSPQFVLVYCKHVQARLKSDGLLSATNMFNEYVVPIFPGVLKQVLENGQRLEGASLGATVLDVEKLLHMDTCLDSDGLYGLAACYVQLRMFDQAEPLFEKALAQARWRGGGKSPLVGNILSGMGDMHALTGKCSQAMMEYQESLSDYEPGSLAEIVCFLHMANAQMAAGKYADAETLYKKALALEDARKFQDKRFTRSILLNYAALLRRAKRVAEATILEKRAEQIAAPK
jgi:serine/threonine protein kinase